MRVSSTGASDDDDDDDDDDEDDNKDDDDDELRRRSWEEEGREEGREVGRDDDSSCSAWVCERVCVCLEAKMIGSRGGCVVGEGSPHLHSRCLQERGTQGYQQFFDRFGAPCPRRRRRYSHPWTSVWLCLLTHADKILVELSRY